MPVEVRLRQVAESMGSAKIVVWLKSEGDEVMAGEVIAEIETDKVTVELQAPGSGTLRKIHVQAGSGNLSVGQLLAVIQDDVAEAAPTFKVEPSQPVIDVRGSPTRDCAASLERPQDPDLAVTPLAQRMASIMGVDLTAVRGTGPSGRIRKQDLERHISPDPSPVRIVSASKPKAAVVSVDSPSAPFEERRPTAMRSITAERLTLSKQTVPHFYLTIDCNADALLAAKASMNKQGAAKLTVTDFVVRAVALALVRVSAANSAWVDGVVRVYGSCDIAVAVNTPTGLITPVVREAQTKGLATISKELKTLTERARDGRLRKEDYAGGTFTISNLGMYGISSLYAIVNPPQSCVLGIGAIQRHPVVRDEQIVIGSTMTCTLSADHRAIDGATGAELLAEFCRYIQDPLLLVF